MPLLTVLYAAPPCPQAADRALTALRRALPRSMEPGRAVLLFCDLPDAPLEAMPEDALLLRRLQSGVMSVAQRRPGCAMLLVRRRVWDDAARLRVQKIYDYYTSTETLAKLVRHLAA